MKRLLFLFLAALMMVVPVVSCKKDTKDKKDIERPKHVPEGAVDLGIVMTREDGTTYYLYWATCNICVDGFVSSPEVFGDYYAWGETAPKSEYNWSTYKFGTSDNGPFSKYVTKEAYGEVDNKTVLETGPEGDDVVSKLLGGKWRMPTDAEWTALREKCEWVWTDNYNNTLTAGRIVTSKIEGYQDKSIFLPAACHMFNSTLQDTAHPHGSYWSSSLYEYNPQSAGYVGFYNEKVSRYDFFRCSGYSVRPVYED